MTSDHQPEHDYHAGLRQRQQRGVVQQTSNRQVAGPLKQLMERRVRKSGVGCFFSWLPRPRK